MFDDGDNDSAGEGLRERKRRETRQRIGEAGIALFTTQGYEATTIDAIASAAGISRRTFFHYFKTKDDILLALQSGSGAQLAAALARQPADQEPVSAVRNAMLDMIGTFTHDGLVAIDKLMRASEAAQGRKQTNYLRDEAIVFDALQARWGDQGETALRLIATLAVNAMRLSLNAWSSDGRVRPLAGYVTETFAALETVFRKA